MDKFIGNQFDEINFKYLTYANIIYYIYIYHKLWDHYEMIIILFREDEMIMMRKLWKFWKNYKKVMGKLWEQCENIMKLIRLN